MTPDVEALLRMAAPVYGGQGRAVSAGVQIVSLMHEAVLAGHVRVEVDLRALTVVPCVCQAPQRVPRGARRRMDLEARGQGVLPNVL